MLDCFMILHPAPLSTDGSVGCDECDGKRQGGAWVASKRHRVRGSTRINQFTTSSGLGDLEMAAQAAQKLHRCSVSPLRTFFFHGSASTSAVLVERRGMKSYRATIAINPDVTITLSAAGLAFETSPNWTGCASSATTHQSLRAQG